MVVKLNWGGGGLCSREDPTEVRLALFNFDFTIRQYTLLFKKTLKALTDLQALQTDKRALKYTRVLRFK